MDEDEILYQSIIADPEKVDPDVDVSGFRTQTETRPELLTAVTDYPGFQFDPTQTSYIEDLYNLYSLGVPVIETSDTTPITDTAQIPGVVDTLINVGDQGQGTGGTTDSITDPTLDTTFQDAGAVDAPGTIGTLESLGETTTQIAPTVNVLDEFGVAGDVYADVPPTTVNTPALDLSGTSTDLINQGVIETPQEFYGRTYNDAPSNYEFLDNEEQLLVDQEYANAYGLAPVPKKALTAVDVVSNLPSVQIAKGAIDLITPEKSVSEQLTINPDTGLFEGGDPVVDAAENEIATVGEQLGTVGVDPNISQAALTSSFFVPSDSSSDETSTTDTTSSVDEADVEAGLATESIDDFSFVDEGTADEQSGSGSGSGGGGGCVIATHAVNSGAFTPQTKREAVRWCVRNLHRTWWGEAVRRGYKYYGQKAIDEGKAKNHYQEFKDYVAFGTGKKRTLKTAWTFVYRTIQFFIKGVFIKNAKR
jgi:hypothetical protein